MGLLLLALVAAGCFTRAGPTEGSVWMRNRMASAATVEVVTTSEGWFPSTIDATITVPGTSTEDCNQGSMFVAPGPVTIRVSGGVISGVQTLSFTEMQPGASSTEADLSHILDIDSAGRVTLAPGMPPAGWQCPGPSPGSG